MLSRITSGTSSHTIATAPASMAFSMNLCPSVAVPFVATNKVSFFTLRESKVTEETATWVEPNTSSMRALYNISLKSFNLVSNLFYRLCYTVFQPQWIVSLRYQHQILLH